MTGSCPVQPSFTQRKSTVRSKELDRLATDGSTLYGARLQRLPARKRSMRLRTARSGAEPTVVVGRGNSDGHCRSGCSLRARTTSLQASSSRPRTQGKGRKPSWLRESNRARQADTGARSSGQSLPRRNSRATQRAGSLLCRCGRGCGRVTRRHARVERHVLLRSVRTALPCTDFLRLRTPRRTRSTGSADRDECRRSGLLDLRRTPRLG